MQLHLLEFKWRSRFIFSLLAFLAFLLIVKTAILTVGNSNRMQSNLAVMNRSPQSFIELGKQVEKLQQITANIDNYKLKEIKDELSTTAILAAHARTEFQAQYDAWISVQGEISRDKESFLKLKQRLDEVQRLQDAEIVRLSNLLEESTKTSIAEDAFGWVLSFIVGVMSSILATSIYDKWNKKRTDL